MRTVIKNGKLITPTHIIEDGFVVIEDGKITSIGSGAVPTDGAEVIDAHQLYVSPGVIDLHTHGAGGADFMDGTVDAFLTAAKMMARHGATLVYPTTLTSTNELLFDSFDTYRKADSLNTEGAAFGGFHLEGPYFSPLMAGAQDPRYLRNPRPEEYNEILSRSSNIARWSLAPELDGALPFAKVLVENGILASIAHTNATFEECELAYQAGFSHITHFYSCTSSVTRRNAYRYAGAVEYGYYQDGMTVEIITDGIHVPQSLLRTLYKIKGSDRIALCTDSMRGAGMPEGKSILGSLADGTEVIIEDGVAKMPDRSCFAGSVATADRLIRTMTTKGGVSLVEAVKMASLTPARIMKIDTRKGSIEVGKDADIILFDEGINVALTMTKGKIIYKNAD